MPIDSTLTQLGYIVQPIASPMPTPSDANPNPEAVAAAAGSATPYARGDHGHPRLTSAHRVTLDSNGLATINYTRTFDAAPAITLTALNPSGRGVMLEQVSDIKTGALFTGCTIRGYRSQLLPNLSSILLIGPLITALSSFDPFAGSAAGVEVSVIAVKASS